MRLRKLLAARDGFTLTELLIVIAIIGILTGVGLLAFNNFTGGADTAVTEANARICATADLLAEQQGLAPGDLDTLFADGQTYAEICGP